MKNWKLETWINIILGLISALSAIFEKQLIKFIDMDLTILLPYLFPFGITLIAVAILRVQNRKTRVLLIGIHELDNIRFHKIKDGKIQELLYLQESDKPDFADTSKEERELKKKLKAIHGLNEYEIDYVCNTLYWNKSKFK
ncbi:MAG: hypothetical protein KFKLKKLM_00591 [Flavobacteriales bacterium]|nr:hypothetical protein [Flavobacteriales bacterium]